MSLDYAVRPCLKKSSLENGLDLKRFEHMGNPMKEEATSDPDSENRRMPETTSSNTREALCENEKLV
jgi:hypothetical protein